MSSQFKYDTSLMSSDSFINADFLPQVLHIVISNLLHIVISNQR